MPRVAIRFRCFNCQQLLGAGQHKIGAVMACPKCGTELVVPDPLASNSDEAAASLAEANVEEPAEGLVGRIETEPMGSSIFERIDLRIEELQVEPEPPAHQKPPERAQASATPIAPVVNLAAEAKVIQSSKIPDATPVALQVGVGNPLAESAAVSLDSPRPQPPPPPPSQNSTHFVAPTVVIRARDVVVPRVVMFAWSLTVLAGIGMAFVAGLMVGHFLWIHRS